mmetsp:Transcript_4907/g.3499  ORF Transcript_4907/g.3499 Transcript_4907/m.3499 type:complete len:113 (-) Transcript_4907:34-372(-)
MSNPFMFDTPDEMLVSLNNWFSDVLLRLDTDHSAAIDVYIDLGHFFTYCKLYDWQDGEGLLTIEELAEAVYAAQSPSYPNLNVVMVHVKKTAGFNLALHTSYSAMNELVATQ